MMTLGAIAGIRVVVSPDVPRYQMPEWLLPPTDKHDGVRWDPALRAATNSWARSFLGTTNMLPRGTAYMMPGSGVAVMRPEDVARISNLPQTRS